MAFSRFKSNATDTVKATPPPEPTVEPKAEVIKEAEVIGPETIKAPRGLAKLGGLTSTVLAKVAQEADASSFVETFPHLYIKGGNSGGTMAPSKSTESSFPEIVSQLPQGKQVVKGIFMGLRAEAVAWPRNYDDRQEGEKPSINCAIPFSDADGIGMLTTGCENFQFAAREVKRDKWEVPNGGPGHLRPVFQLMLWLPGINHAVVLQAAPLLDSFRAMAKQMNALADPTTGALEPLPISCTVTTEPWYDDNVFHYWKIVPWVDAAAKTAFDGYRDWAGEVVASRPDLVTAVTDWVSGEDKPPSDQDVNRLKQAANLVNPRRARKS